MISKNKIKYIHSLEQKKTRRQEGVFVAEGFKSVGDLIAAGCEAKMIIATEEWLCDKHLPASVEVIAVTEEELRKTSLLQHPQQVIGVFVMPDDDDCELAETASRELCLCLDGVQDPGNLGTIIRTADWFGIHHVICSNVTADVYNPKVVQATMGSIARVKTHYTDLPAFLASLKEGTPVYGTLLDGNNIYKECLSQHGVIVMGNEGNGISDEVRRLLTHKLLIPSYPADSDTAESLNVAIATAVILALFRR